MNAPRPKHLCPVCRSEVSARSRAELPCLPFCSPRCRLVDLGRWLGGDYRLPGPPVEAADAEKHSLPEHPN